MKEYKIGDIKSNPNNPRILKDDDFKQLVKSILDFPEMLHKRPIVVDESMVILGGNQRYKAAVEAGLKTIPVIIADDWDEDQKNQFIVKDNLSAGNWDYMALEDWDTDKLMDWGLQTSSDDVDLDKFFMEPEVKKESVNKIVLKYSDDQYAQVLTMLKSYEGTNEQVVIDLLTSNQ